MSLLAPCIETGSTVETVIEPDTPGEIASEPTFEKPSTSPKRETDSAKQTNTQPQINERLTMQDAIGLLETKGLLALIEATDAMAKAANVKIVKRVDIGGGLATTVVRGDVGSVRAAVEAGANAASQAGELIASHIIPRPADGLFEAYLS